MHIAAEQDTDGTVRQSWIQCEKCPEKYRSLRKRESDHPGKRKDYRISRTVRENEEISGRVGRRQNHEEI